jgi:hypothetical protein
MIHAEVMINATTQMNRFAVMNQVCNSTALVLTSEMLSFAAICAAGSQCSDNGCISNNEPSQTDLEPSQEPTEEPPTSAEPTETGEPNPTEVFSSEDTAVTDEPTTSEVFTASDQTQNDPSTEPETITTDSPSITSTLPINTDTSTTTLENPTSSGAAALYAEGACVAILGGLLANVLLT